MDARQIAANVNYTAWFRMIAALCLMLSAGQAWAQQQVTVLRGATLIDVASSSRIPNSVVIMEGGRFRSVGKEEQVAIPPGARVIDLTGKFLIPGLIDSHIHYRDWFGEVLLANGVTSFLDQANPTEWSIALKEAYQMGKLRTPRIFITGNQLDGPNDDGAFLRYGYLDAWVNGPLDDQLPLSTKVTYSDGGRNYKTFISDPAEGRREVRRLVQRGIDVIKVHHMLSPDVLKAITDEAHRANLPVVGHRVDARELAELGMDFVEHTAPVAVATVTDKKTLQDLKDGKLLDPSPYMDPKAFPELFRTLASKNIYWNPTLAETWFGVSPKKDKFRAEAVQYFSNPDLRYIPRAELSLSLMDISERITPAETELLQKGFRNVQLAMKAFVDAGGKLLVSPDSGTIRLGIGMHQEMELLVEGGISPADVLKGATLYPAQLLRKDKDLGTIEAGKLADLVVLAADPLSDITNTRKIERVFLGGEQVDTSFHPDYKLPIPRPVEISNDLGGSIRNIVPNIATEGDADVTVELVGSFTPGSKVIFNKTAVQSTFEGAGRMKAVIPAVLLKDVGTYPVHVEEEFEGQTYRSNRIFFVVKYR